MKLEMFDTKNEGWQAYGFMVYNHSGYSLPKGMITSFKVEQFSNMSIEIDFSVQSPSGDASDHHNYSIPAIKSFAQCKQIVDMYAQMVESWITEESKTESI